MSQNMPTSWIRIFTKKEFPRKCPFNVVITTDNILVVELPSPNEPLSRKLNTSHTLDLEEK